MKNKLCKMESRYTQDEMSRKKSILKDKSKTMTVSSRSDVISSNYLGSSSMKSKTNQWPEETGSSNWDGNSRATSSSWPEDIEEAATNKVLKLWAAVERTLYKEDDQVKLGDVMDECIQWRTQIPHYRIVGKNIEPKDDDEEEVESVVEQEDKVEELSPKDQHLIQIKCEQVLDRLMEYIMIELEKEMDDDNVNNDSSNNKSMDNLDQVLRIAPAPTYSGRRLNINRDKDSSKSNGSSKSSANLNKFESFELTERTDTALKALRSNKDADYGIIDYDYDVEDDDEDEDEDDEDRTDAKLGRNKLGTVFNNKIVVSPVPFAVTTRESFCTLKTTPIKYAGHLLELSTPQGFNRNMNSASKLNYVQRKSPMRSQRHSSWQSSVNPAWPKNVRLAPIDPSRLPSSKNRSIGSPTIQHRNRNSLSPISRAVKPSSSSYYFNGDDFLEVTGKQITQSAKLTRLKTGRDSPSNRHIKKSAKSISKI
ncbi:uncharacterized protein LOC130672287 isoform X2 [Microplitis mediator]|uniref:uncharacterized protein LOC130672287 isoform X2 n=2 Tax=Microplitis mediator TaxID=375433 RepID=UPI0025573F8D|nr:uncharacterized protein LOC130672287 isoform X2 [Microplitis mediator]